MSRLILIAFCLFVAALVPQFTHAENASIEEWLNDIQFLDDAVRSTHPAPFTKTTESDWAAGIENLRKTAATGNDQKIALSLMQHVASIGDGHTHLEPTDEPGFQNWYPIRFYQFEDGLFITVAHRDYSELIGAKVTQIGSAKPIDALSAISTIISADNEFQSKELTAAFLSSAPILKELGIAQNDRELWLNLELPNGETQRTKIAARNSYFSANYRFLGELFGPPLENYDNYATPFLFGQPPLSYRTVNEDAPPYYAGRNPYWFRWDEERKTFLFQFNFAAEIEESFDDFQKRMWELADSVEVERFVIDLRYNFGGDGSMMLPFIHELIRREAISQPGKLYVLTGRQTFSAGVMLLAHLRTHTRAVFIGEPAGAPFNHFGDPISLSLPNSNMTLNISSLYWQLGHPSDNDPFIAVDIPVVPIASDYFNEIDSAYETATQGNAIKSLLDVFLSDGSEAGLKTYEARKTLYDHLPWWRSLDTDTDTLNKAVNKFLAASDKKSAKALLETWAQTQPQNDTPRRRLSELNKQH